VSERTLAEEVVAALLAGAAGLLVDLRFEHREALGETWRAWVPLVFSALLVTVGAVALARFRRGGRRVLMGLFATALVVGSAGLWFHSKGHPLQGLTQVAAAWAALPGSNAGVPHDGRPPALAPGAFIGIGALGLLACRRP
jgi:hypothetical protein